MQIRRNEDNSSLQFYDEFAGKLLSDYVYGNARTQHAIKFAIENLPRECNSIIDIGCGIGWSTWEIANQCPGSSALGLDLSEKLINIATLLYEDKRVHFKAQNICTLESLEYNTAHAAAMLDVYEHIPRQNRVSVHENLSKILATDAVLLLTTPSIELQDHLRSKHPELLQPVDENVSEEDFERLARDIGGRLVSIHRQEIWKHHVYLYAVIARGTVDLSGAKKETDNVPSEKYEHRVERVQKRLAIKVGRTGVVFPERNAPTIAVVNHNEDAYSETFIRAHLQHLPFNVVYLSGTPLRDLSGQFVESQSTVSRVIRKFSKKLLRTPAEFFQNRALSNIIHEQGVAAVLAEFGPVAVNCMAACRDAKIPLIAHFHGYDAFVDTIISELGQKYKELFGQAAAIIAVSQDMKAQLINLGANAEKVHCVSYGVDINRFNSSRPGAAPPLFIAVGRFVEKKAPHLTIMAFREVVERVPEAKLIMVGNGPLHGPCKQLIRALQLEKAIELPGIYRPWAVVELMKTARAFVQHSVRATDGDAEGAPVSIMEAQASGLPIVATKHMGIKEEVVHAQTGFLVDEYDVESMSRYMIQLAIDPVLAGEMGKKARQHAEKFFSLDQRIDALAKVIEYTIDHE